MSVSLHPIYTQTVGAGGGTVTFNNIPQGYNDLMVVISGRGLEATTMNYFYMQANSVGLAGSYSMLRLYGTGTAVGADKSLGIGGDYMYAALASPNANATANTFGSATILISEYTSGNYKPVMIEGVGENNAAFANMSFGAGTIYNKAPITSLFLGAFGGFAQNSTISLYGVGSSFDTSAPAAPTITSVTDVGGAVSVAFTTNDTGQGALADKYYVTSSPATVTTYGSSSPIVATNLVSGQSYTFRVTAENAVGSNISAASSVITPVNSYGSIASFTMGATTTNVIRFTNIPQHFTHLQIKGIARNTGANTEAACVINFNEDGGSGNYSTRYTYANGTTTTGASTASASNIWGIDAPGTAVAASTFGAGVIDILDYSTMTKHKTVRGISGWDANGSGFNFIVSGVYKAFSPVQTITLTCGQGNFAQYTSFALYGIG